MFDTAVINTDKFLKVSLTAKALYFLLGMEADDEGFVSPTRILRLYGGEYGDIKNLIDAGLVIPFESGVVVITDWHTNNWLDSRRTKSTQYQDEAAQLSLVSSEKGTSFTKDKKYVLSIGSASAQPEERRGEEKRTDNTIQAPADAGRTPPKKKKSPEFNALGADVIKAFESVDPKNATYYGNKTQRAACDHLLEVYGLDEILKRVSVLSRTNKVPFFPRINSPHDLKEKWVKLDDAVAAKRAEKITESLQTNERYVK